MGKKSYNIEFIEKYSDGNSETYNVKIDEEISDSVFEKIAYKRMLKKSERTIDKIIFKYYVEVELDVSLRDDGELHMESTLDKYVKVPKGQRSKVFKEIFSEINQLPKCNKDEYIESIESIASVSDNSGEIVNSTPKQAPVLSPFDLYAKNNPLVSFLINMETKQTQDGRFPIMVRQHFKPERLIYSSTEKDKKLNIKLNIVFTEKKFLRYMPMCAYSTPIPGASMDDVFPIVEARVYDVSQARGGKIIGIFGGVHALDPDGSGVGRGENAELLVYVIRTKDGRVFEISELDGFEVDPNGFMSTSNDRGIRDSEYEFVNTSDINVRSAESLLSKGITADTPMNIDDYPTELGLEDF